MRRREWVLMLLIVTVGSSAGWTYFKRDSAGTEMTRSAQLFLATLDDDEKVQTLLDYETPKRVGWHFIPKNDRKGLQIRDMNKAQREATHRLLKGALSRVGYDKSTTIMELESVLHELEKDKQGGNIRDAERYYVTIFGEPTPHGRWGLSFEGHHLSLNFVVDRDRVVSSTPQFLGANPATVRTENNLGIEVGTRVLRDEEQLGFDLVQSLSTKQLSVARIAETAFREIRNAGEPQPPTDAPVGLPASKMSSVQRKTLGALIDVYLASMPAEVARARMAKIEHAGRDAIYFAWAGPTVPGIGHYFRVQGPTFLIEFVNTQPDAAGNPANHIHAIWREMAGDFGIRIRP